MAATRFLDVIPRFAVPDVAAAVAYYQDVLGFLLVNSLGDPPVFAIVGRNNVEVQLSRQGSLPGPTQGAWHVYFRVTGLDEMLAEFRAKGAKVVMEPITRPYGMRETIVEDPHGYWLAFGEAVD